MSSAKLYVGNLNYDTTDTAIEALFGQFGEVVTVNLITDRDSGRPKGFGFVEMASLDMADAAKSALTMVQEGETDIEALPFKPEAPELTADTAAWLAQVEKALQDSITAIEAPFTYTKDSVRNFRRAFLDSVDHLAAAYGQYPNNGSSRYFGSSLTWQSSWAYR